ncbi:MAG: hypothetical protein ACT4QD_25255 [Acidobacteriota bacterium]
MTLATAAALALALGAGRPAASALSHRQAADRAPLDVARLLAARYPAQPIMSYIPALSWSGSFRLAQLTGEEKWREKPRREMQPFLSGATPAIAEPYLLTSLAGHLAFADAAAFDNNRAGLALAQKAADFVLPQSGDDIVRFARKWTDDMFMAVSLLARVGAATKDPTYSAVAARLLTPRPQRRGRPRRRDGAAGGDRSGAAAPRAQTVTLSRLQALGWWPRSPCHLRPHRGLAPSAETISYGLSRVVCREAIELPVVFPESGAAAPRP